MERFMAYTPTKSEESILENQTISNGLAFKWIENGEVKSLLLQMVKSRYKTSK